MVFLPESRGRLPSRCVPFEMLSFLCLPLGLINEHNPSRFTDITLFHFPQMTVFISQRNYIPPPPSFYLRSRDRSFRVRNDIESD